MKAALDSEREWQSALIERGWALVENDAGPLTPNEAIRDRMNSMLQRLGRVVRARRQVGMLRPRSKDEARPASLSARYGLGTFPFHMDGAHWPTPPRYIALTRVDAEPGHTATRVLDTRRLERDELVRRRADSEVFFVENGKHSFYSSIVSFRRPYFRLDPGCMRPITEGGRAVLAYFDAMATTDQAERIVLTRGQTLILDNWRVLHARDAIGPTERGRVILRGVAT